MPLHSFRHIFTRESPRHVRQGAPFSGDRAETIQRLQIGFGGLVAMFLLVGLANIIMNSARETQATVVPEAQPEIAVPVVPKGGNDPLADAGVVPDLPAEPKPTPTPLPVEPGPVIDVPPAQQP